MDILGLGAVAVDELLYVSNHPPPDAKVPILRRCRRVGGQTGNALIAAARLGAHCAYAGVLGDDADAQFVRETLAREGIDLAHLTNQTGAKPIRCTILVEEGSGRRTVLYDLEGCVPAPVEVPEDVIRAARVLYVDQFGVEGMIRAARIARSAGIPVVADLERSDWPGFEMLLGLVDHLILGRDAAAALTREAEPATMIDKLWSQDRQLVAVTDGAAGCWNRGSKNTITHQPALEVKATDTTGCGDVFHGAYAAALARGWEESKRIEFATVAAALRARDGESPRLAQVKAMLF